MLDTVQLNAPFTDARRRQASAARRDHHLLRRHRPSELSASSITGARRPRCSGCSCGAAVDQMEIVVNGDYHEVHFKGLAQDVMDSSSFSRPVGQLQSFPPEPVARRIRFFGSAGQSGTGLAGERAHTVPHDHQRIRS